MRARGAAGTARGDWGKAARVRSGCVLRGCLCLRGARAERGDRQSLRHAPAAGHPWPEEVHVDNTMSSGGSRPPPGVDAAAVNCCR